MKIGIQMNAFQCPIEEQFKLLKKHGFDATFCAAHSPQLDEMMELSKQYGIEVENYHAPFSHINDIWDNTPQGEEMLNELLLAVDACKRHAVDTLIVHMSMAQKQVTDLGFSRFAELMAAAKESGVTIAYENLSMLGNLACIFERYKEAGFCWDVGHEKAYTHGRQYMPLFADRLAALHVHDNHCVHDEDEHMIPYDGTIDFDRVTTEIAKANYGKSLMLETMARRNQAYIDMGADEFYRRASIAARRLADEVEYKKAELLKTK